MGPVARESGKRAGSRRGAPAPRKLPRSALGYAAGITLAVVAWGFLVWSAVDFGVSARSGETEAWWFLALASIGAMACLFVALMLVVRLSRALGITTPPAPRGTPVSQAPVAETRAAETPVSAAAELGDTAERPAIRPGGHRADR